MRQQKYTQAQQVIDNQGLIIEIGNMKHYATYVPAQDQNRKFLEKPLKDVSFINYCLLTSRTTIGSDNFFNFN